MADRGKLEAALQAARETVADLERKKASAERELGRLERVKEPLVLPGLSGDRTQGRRLRATNERILEQRQTVADHDAAIEQAGRQVAAIERELAIARDADAAFGLAAKHGELLEADRRIDDLALALATALDERAGIIKTIQKAMGPTLLKRLGLDPQLASWATWRVGRGGQGVITRALKFAGLRDHVDFGFTGGPQANVPMGRLSYPELETVIAALKHEEPAQQEAA